MRAFLLVSLILGGLAAQDLAQGVAAYKAGNYPQAAEAFRRAVAADPNSMDSRLYLATSLMTQYIPGAGDSANLAFAQEAETEFEAVLARDPGNKVALASLASLAYQEAQGLDSNAKQAKLDVASERYQKLTLVDPYNKEAFYSLGVIDWLRWYPVYQDSRAQLGMKPKDPGPLTNYNARQDLRLRFEPVIEDGLRNLQRALAIDPKYDDAMAYMNLLIRERADLRDTRAEYQADTALADQWVQKALDMKKAKAQASAGNPTEAVGIRAMSGALPPISNGGGGGGGFGSDRTPSATPQRIRVGGNIQANNILTKVTPVYPPLAKQAGIEGTVRFTMVIGRDGTVVNLQLVSGHPLLVEAARAAVSQWIYKPTLLNGQPVEVVTQVDVNFTLAQ